MTRFNKRQSIKISIDKLQKDMVERALASNELASILDSNEYSQEFNFFRWLKFFLYHILFFMFGPFMSPIVILFDSVDLLHNMGFSLCSKYKIAVFYQYQYWLFNVFFIILWILRAYQPQKNWLSGIYPEQGWYLLLHSIIRGFVVGIRYAFFSDLRHQLYIETSQSIEFLGKDLFIQGWLEFHPTGGLWDEIQSSLFRNQIEERYFTINFVEVLDQTSAKRLTEVQYYHENIISDAQIESITKVRTLRFLHKERFQELVEQIKEFYSHRSALMKMIKKMDTIKKEGQKESMALSEQNQDLYNYIIPSKVDDVIKNLGVRYQAKLFMREIALFAAATQLSNKLPFICAMLRGTTVGEIFKDEDNIITGSLMQILVRQIRAYHVMKPHKTKEDVRKKIDKLIKEVDIIRERLEFESNHHPLRIMGLKATYELMNQIYTGIATLIFGVVQWVISQNNLI